MPKLHIRQNALNNGKYPIQLTLENPPQFNIEGKAEIEFALTDQEQKDMRWYMEKYLEVSEGVEPITIRQIEEMMIRRGEELYHKVLKYNDDTQAIWFAIRPQLSDLRIEITSGVAEAASIPWELMREPASDSAIALRARAFVRIQSNTNSNFVKVPPLDKGRVRLLLVIARPGREKDIELRCDANRILHNLKDNRERFDIKVLRPPTFENLQNELKDAKENGCPYHIVHFDGHGSYSDLTNTSLEEWLATLEHLRRGDSGNGKHGFVLFEHPDKSNNMRPVDGETLGKLLHDNGSPILILNACQSAMHEAKEKPDEEKEKKEKAKNVHDEIRAIGSLAQAVIDQGIPAVLGMRYSVYVVTAAQYIGQLYSDLAKGREFGQAASYARKHLHLNPERWVGLKPRPLQDWFVPVIYEAAGIRLIDPIYAIPLEEQREMDPVQIFPNLLRYVPDSGFIGRDETILALDRAFDAHCVVLLYAYAGQGKTTTAVEFARWYSMTGGLGPQPFVLVTSFENHTDLNGAISQIGNLLSPLFAAGGIEWNAINDAEKRRSLIIQILREIPVIWIWDNVEPVAGFPEGTVSQWTKDEQEELSLFLKQIKHDKKSKVKLLLTSRRSEKKWLKEIPFRIEMPRMRNSDAANLALSIANSLDVKRRFTREVIGEWISLIDYCQGNPMTIRVLVGQAIKENRRKKEDIENFVEAIRSGEKEITDEDREQGRDKSLGASLDYGFKHAFKEDELSIIALLHLFQGVVNVEVLQTMGDIEEHSLPVLNGKTEEYLISLLERASEVGLLTQNSSHVYIIHPALPWFLKSLYDRCYTDNKPTLTEQQTIQKPKSKIQNLLAWAKAIGILGDYCHNQYEAGENKAIQALDFEEDNLLYALRISRQNGWCDNVTSVMQGLRTLYQHCGRINEWAKLVYEIVPDFCDENDEPIKGREDQYSLIMGYRVGLYQDSEHDLKKAIQLQEKIVIWNRKQASDILQLPENAELSANQLNQIRTLGNGIGTLGQILFEQNNSLCIEKFQEAIQLFKRIKETNAEAIALYNIGNAYMMLPEIRNLDAAEENYNQGLKLHQSKDALGRSRFIKQIGMVHHERFRDARKDNKPKDVLIHHIQLAEKHYLEAINLCPKEAIVEIAPMYFQLGNLYQECGVLDSAQDNYEKAIQYYEDSGDRFNAGITRYNVSNMYVKSSRIEEKAAKEAKSTDEQNQHLRARRDFLERAKAYAEAALRDFEFYQGRAADKEDEVKAVIARIDKALKELDSAG